MSVPIKLNADSVQAPRSVFSLANAVQPVSGLIAPYDISPEGNRLIVFTIDQGKSYPINLITSWTAAVEITADAN